jgi:hypothetical protein
LEASSQATLHCCNARARTTQSTVYAAGSTAADANLIYAGVIDRALANIVLNALIDDGFVDAARETIRIRTSIAACSTRTFLVGY